MMRSWLFVPADSEKKLAKAFTTDADIVILDLEDSIAPDRKGLARGLAREAIAEAPERAAVRINALSSEAAQADIDTVVGAGPAVIVLPKCERGADAAHLSALLSVAEAEADRPDGAIGIMGIATETARSLFHLGSYAGATTRLMALAWGAEDLSTVLAAERTRHSDGTLTDAFALARTLCLAGAHAADVMPLDTVFTDIRDDAGLRAEAEAAAADGFFGKMAIHPAQVGPINEAFTPAADAVAMAQRIVDAFANDPSAGVLAIDGKMVDRPHLTKAERLLVRAGRHAGPDAP